MRLQSTSMRRALSSTVIIGILAIMFILVSVLTLNIGGGGQSGAVRESELFDVTRGNFEIRVPTSGELEAQEQINIRNQVESAVVVSLVDEGAMVETGDVLFKLNDENLLETIRNAEINVTSAKNDLQNSETNLSIAEKKRDSEIATKQLAVNLAELALHAWKEGDVIAKRQELELAVQTAQKDFDRLEKKYASSKTLYEQKFLSKDELDQDEIALLRSDAALKKAKLSQNVYEQYTFEKERQQKESDLTQAKGELERATERLESELGQATENVVAKRNNLAKREEQLANKQDQLDKCVVNAPSPGMVVYASSLSDRREEDERLRVGRSLWRNQLVMIIPDTDMMIARVKVNEALSGLVQEGQRATVVCDAYPDTVFEGAVHTVGVLATGGGWRDPNRRDYTVEIRILDKQGIVLKPSMRCAAEIYVEEVEDVTYVPVHAIRRDGDLTWVWVQQDGGFEQRPVSVDRFSETFAEITEGLNVGERILLRDPSPATVVSTVQKEGNS